MGERARKVSTREGGRNVVKMPYSLPPVNNGKRQKRSWKSELGVWAVDIAIVGSCFYAFLWAAGHMGQ